MSTIVDCFRRMIRGTNKHELKGYKVTDVKRTRKFGIACRNLQELKRKACAKLGISTDEQEKVTVCLVDGSQIDDEYFHTIEPQTILIIRRPNEELLSDADLLYNTLRRVNLEFLTAGDAISKFLSDNLKCKVAVLNKALNRNDASVSLSTREDHPEWFANLETSVKTKEAYMHRRCQDRIRCYLYKTIEQIKSSDIYAKNETARRHLTHVILFFKLQLREDHYFGYYFDRSYAKDKKQIGGGGDETDSAASFHCPYDHCACRINLPWYGSSQEILSRFFSKEETEATTDEPDAQRMSPTKRAKKNEDEELFVELCNDELVKADKDKQFSICDANGEFKCNGVWNAEECAYGERHKINPYRSREELILFSTWNLDHRIERSRSLIPNLLKASEEDRISQENIRYFYDNIFTVKNLRLVHVICHDKGAHNL